MRGKGAKRLTALLARLPGVGEKTAAKLLNQYGSLDGIFAHATDQTPKLAANLIEGSGVAVAKGDAVRVRYVGYSWKTGKVIDDQFATGTA